MVLKYRYLGKGYTDENGIAHMTEDADGQAVTGYTGTGRGKTDIIASTDDKEHISDSSLLSETFVTYDCIVVEDELTANKTFNKSLNNQDLYIEFTVHPTADSGIARLLIRESSTSYLYIGDLYANANCGVQWNNNGNTSYFYGKAIPFDVDTKVTMTRRGTNITLTVGESTYNITNMPIQLNTFETVFISYNAIKDLKVYPI